MARRGEPSERTCIVTRQALPVDSLVRFVAAPDGTVVADLRRRLPGRGVWVTNTAATVAAAEKRRLFSRAFGAEAKVEPGLAGRVAEAYLQAAVAALSLARKAGEAVAGFVKVETAIARGSAVALIHAPDAGTDGVAKLSAAWRRRFGAASEPVVIGCFTAEQLDLAFGRANVIHAAVLAGAAGDNLLARVRAFEHFVGRQGVSEDPGLSASHPILVSAGS
jgi:predicted RNA-binding protein YlxR (DUF448 family)